MGDQVGLASVEGGGFVDVIGTTKGRGFQGVVKRHNMSGGRASHGSGNHRAPGSIGMCVNPARVIKGKKMPGHMGSQRVTTPNLRIVLVDEERNLIAVRGPVPGHKGGVVMIKEARKR